MLENNFSTSVFFYFWGACLNRLSTLRLCVAYWFQLFSLTPVYPDGLSPLTIQACASSTPANWRGIVSDVKLEWSVSTSNSTRRRKRRRSFAQSRDKCPTRRLVVVNRTTVAAANPSRSTVRRSVVSLRPVCSRRSQKRQTARGQPASKTPVRRPAVCVFVSDRESAN